METSFPNFLLPAIITPKAAAIRMTRDNEHGNSGLKALE
jgi:hypothetical protein